MSRKPISTRSPATKATAKPAAPTAPASTASTVGNAFPWLSPSPTAAAASDSIAASANKFLAMHRRELRERASLLRRLGFEKSEVRKRLESYQDWEYEPFHHSLLLSEIARLVDEIFAPSSPRTTTLSPGR